MLLEVFVMIDEDGDYAVATDAANLKDAYENDVGELDGTRSTRIVALTLNMNSPAPATATIVIPDEPDTARVTLQPSPE